MEPILELKGVSKSFNSKAVLHDIDLSVSKGRVVGLLGKNGSGKTTLLKCALGLLKIRSGSVRVFGEPAWDLSRNAKMKIGYVPQKLDLYSWMTVRQLVQFIAAFYPRWNHALSTSLVTRWELNWEDKVSTLSEGQIHKLGLILGMGHEPELLVLDEPAASLDPQARRTFLSAVIEIASNENRTVILSTHLTSDLERVASDVVLLKDGAIRYACPMDELKDSVKSLRLTTRGKLPLQFDLPGVLRCERDGNTALLTMQGVNNELVHQMEQTYAADIEVGDLNLEDIFVAVHRA